jgi:hypothetical protein
VVSDGNDQGRLPTYLLYVSIDPSMEPRIPYDFDSLAPTLIHV